MKKLVYLFSILVFTSFMGCEKEPVNVEEEIVDPNQITPEMLFGDWTFVSLEFNGEVYYGCDERIYDVYWLTTLNFKDNDENYFYMYSDCNETNYLMEANWDYNIIDNNLLLLANETFKFEILSTVNDLKLGNLMLKLIWARSDNLPIDGVFTLQQ